MLTTPISLRRQKLHSNTPDIKTVPIKYKNMFKNKAKVIKPRDWRIENILNKIKINTKIIHDTILPKNSATDDKSTNSKTRTNQIIQNQNTQSLSKWNSLTSKIIFQIITTSTKIVQNKEKKLVELLFSKIKNC